MIGGGFMLSKPVQKLAKRFSLDIEYAEEYIKSIQQLCSPNSPQYLAIVQIILDKKTTTLPKPEKIAGEINKEVARIARNKDYEIVSKRSKRLNTWHVRQKLGYAKLYDTERPGTTGHELGVISHSKLDDERVSRDSFDRCPHGVPKGMICAICNPEEYRNMVGSE
jgi:hypothetical protein